MSTIIRRFAGVRADGSPCEILERQAIVSHEPLNGPRRQVGGSRDYILSTGEDLDPRDDGTFEVIQTGEIIRSA